MASTPTNLRTSFLANTSQLKSTPSNSPFARTPRSPHKPRGLYESGLSLKRIIGNTVSSPTSFDSLPTSKLFAYTAGAAAVVVDVAEEAEGEATTYTQRFFRARPTAVPQVSGGFGGSAGQNGPSTPTHTANDGRNRSIATLRDSGYPYSPNGPSIGLDWGDSPSSKTWTSRERIKAATCLSVSRDGRFLAVGETGYSPRVLIFSLQDTSSDVPLAILTEHTFGVRAVAFSPDQRYLASIGHPNDGFLYVWAVNQRTGAAKLHSSNKCTSAIRQMIWLGRNLVTVGTRHIKIWKVEESRSISPVKKRYALDGTPIPSPIQPLVKTLAGRNVLLGPLVEAVFTCIAAITDHKAIVCSEKGDICLIDDSEGQKLVRVGNAGFSVTCVAVDMQDRQVRIGGVDGKVKSIDLDALLTPMTPPESPVPTDETVTALGIICAMGYAGKRLVTIDSNRSIEISRVESGEKDSTQKVAPFTAHGAAVLGVRLLGAGNELGAAFFTWSADGTIMFWDMDGSSKGKMNVELEQFSSSEEEPVNQCNVVRASEAGSLLVTGDRYGVLRVYDTRTKECAFETRAHSSDIQDIALYESKDEVLMASCGRDRTIQLFRKGAAEWSLMQTLDEHTASVCRVLFAEDGGKLISCSADRTVHVRQVVKKEVGSEELVLAVPGRIITVKASPLSMTLCLGEQSGLFMVSLLDRTVGTYELSTGKLMASFRATDFDGTEAVALDGLQMGLPGTLPTRPTILAGFSSTDKSVRIYDGMSGGFLDREWGHTAAVTDIALLEQTESEQKTVISTGSDGTIMIWYLSPSPSSLGDAIDLATREPSPPKETPSAKPPLRRVLSRAEMSEFQRISPVSTPTGRTSPPRIPRRRTSRYGLAQTQSPALAPPMPSLPATRHYPSASADDSLISSKKSLSRLRTRSRSPPASPKSKDSRRPSLASLHSDNGGSLRGRTKSSPNFSEFGSLNMATEQACRTLRAYRKKLLGSESVREETLRELEAELKFTTKAIAERRGRDKKDELESKGGGAITEEVLKGVLDRYSERLVSLFDEKLRLGGVGSGGERVDEMDEDPKGLGLESDMTISPGQISPTMVREEVEEDAIPPTSEGKVATGVESEAAEPLKAVVSESKSI